MAKKVTTYQVNIYSALHCEHSYAIQFSFGRENNSERHQVNASSFDELDAKVDELVANYGGAFATDLFTNREGATGTPADNYLDISIDVPEIIRLPEGVEEPGMLPLQGGGFGRKQRKPAGFQARYGNSRYLPDPRVAVAS